MIQWLSGLAWLVRALDVGSAGFYLMTIVALHIFSRREARRLAAKRLRLEELSMQLDRFYISTFHMHAEVLQAHGKPGPCRCSVCTQARVRFGLSPTTQPPSHSS